MHHTIPTVIQRCLRMGLLSKNVRCIHRIPEACNRQKPKPVVFLCGWAASTELRLRKYAIIYRQLGWECHVFPGSIPLLWSTWLMYSSTKRRLQKVTAESDERRDAVIHLFSSSPGFILPWLLRAIAKHPLKLDLKGLVFDSSPTKISRDMIWLGAQDRVESGRINPLLLGPPVAITLVIDWLYNHLANAEKRMQTVLSSACVQAVPHLYLYSKTDTVVPPSYIEKWIKYQGEQGVMVRSHVWEDSQHNKHFRKYPKEYMRVVHSFASKCVMDQSTEH